MKILLLENVVVNYGDDRGGVIEAAGALVSPAAAVAHSLVNQGRALYTTKSDDPSKGLKTAPADIVKAAESAGKADTKVAAKSGGGEGEGE